MLGVSQTGCSYFWYLRRARSGGRVEVKKFVGPAHQKVRSDDSDYGSLNIRMVAAACDSSAAPMAHRSQRSRFVCAMNRLSQQTQHSIHGNEENRTV